MIFFGSPWVADLFSRAKMCSTRPSYDVISCLRGYWGYILLPHSVEILLQVIWNGWPFVFDSAVAVLYLGCYELIISCSSRYWKLVLRISVIHRFEIFSLFMRFLSFVHFCIKRRICIYTLGFRNDLMERLTACPTSMRLLGSYHSSVSFMYI